MARWLSSLRQPFVQFGKIDWLRSRFSDVWRRSNVPTEALNQLAEADAFLPSLKLQRRDATWASKVLRDETLPLFAAAAGREASVIAEQQEPEVELRQMTGGHNVVEHYGHVGLTLREHPIAFLRKDLQRRNIVTCSDAMNARDGRWVTTAGLVLVSQKQGSAKGVLFIAIEDETGPADVVVWPSHQPRKRRVRFVVPSTNRWNQRDCAGVFLKGDFVMPAKSKAQQKAAGAALSAKRGETPKKLKGASKEMVDSMSEKQRWERY